jgi:hypothetical protein
MKKTRAEKIFVFYLRVIRYEARSSVNDEEGEGDRERERERHSSQAKPESRDYTERGRSHKAHI